MNIFYFLFTLFFPFIGYSSAELNKVLAIHQAEINQLKEFDTRIKGSCLAGEKIMTNNHYYKGVIQKRLNTVADCKKTVLTCRDGKLSEDLIYFGRMIDNSCVSLFSLNCEKLMASQRNIIVEMMHDFQLSAPSCDQMAIEISKLETGFLKDYILDVEDFNSLDLLAGLPPYGEVLLSYDNKLPDFSPLFNFPLKLVDIYSYDLSGVDLSPLKNLNKTNEMSITIDYKTDLTPLNSLTNLKKLGLYYDYYNNPNNNNNTARRISSLAGLKNLTSFSIGLNTLDFDFLFQLPRLNEVNFLGHSMKKFEQNIQNNFPQLANLERLTSIGIYNGIVDSFTFLKSLNHLTTLGLSYVPNNPTLPKLPRINAMKLDCQDAKKIEKSLFAQVPNLERLELGNDGDEFGWHELNCLKLESISEVEVLKKLKYIKVFSLKLNNLNGIEQLKELRELDLHLDTDLDLTPIASLTKLTNLKIVTDDLKNLSTLSNLTNLTNIDIRARWFKKNSSNCPTNVASPGLKKFCSE